MRDGAEHRAGQDGDDREAATEKAEADKAAADKAKGKKAKESEFRNRVNFKTGSQIYNEIMTKENSYFIYSTVTDLAKFLGLSMS